MAFRFILLVLPALVLAGIEVHIFGEFNKDMKNIHISFSGNDSAIITDTERNTFNLDSRKLNKAIYRYTGQEPSNAVLRNPTPWGDIYKKKGWSQVKRILKPRSGKLVDLSYEPVGILQRVFENNGSIAKTFKVGITQKVKNTVSSSWSTEGKLSIDKNISHDITLVLDVIGQNSLNFSSSWGKHTEELQPMVVGAKSSMDIVLQPNESIVAQLHLTKGRIKLQVEYEASLQGHAVAEMYYLVSRVVNFNFTHYDIGTLMNRSAISNQRISREDIDIEFYVNSKVLVHK